MSVCGWLVARACAHAHGHRGQRLALGGTPQLLSTLTSLSRDLLFCETQESLFAISTRAHHHVQRYLSRC